MIARFVLWSVLLVWSATASAQSVPRFERAGDWSLVCDVDQRCTIVGIANLPNRPGNVRVAISILRENAPDAPSYMRLMLLRWDGVPVEDAHLYGYRLEGPEGGHMLSPSGDMVAGINFLFPAESAATLDWLARHRPRHLLDEGRPYARLPEGDLARLLRRRDQLQPEIRNSDESWAQTDEYGRANYEIFPRDREPLDALPREITRACPGATIENSPAYGIDHNTNPTLMLIVPCGRQTAIFTWFRGAPPTRQTLPDPIARRYSHSTADYDADQGILTLDFTHGRRTDCGYRAQWAWVDGEGLMLLSGAWMPDCRGLPAIFWPFVYQLQGWMVR